LLLIVTPLFVGAKNPIVSSASLVTRNASVVASPPFVSKVIVAASPPPPYASLGNLIPAGTGYLVYLDNFLLFIFLILFIF
jgi:hypothetical protein